jgi:DnaJ-class molecular chaperone
MFLSSKEIRRANNLYSYLKRKTQIELNEMEIDICSECQGTGLSEYQKLECGYYWDSKSYCEKCNGIGYIGLEKQFNYVIFICRFCNGVGCLKCNNTGFTDWISHVMER